MGLCDQPLSTVLRRIHAAARQPRRARENRSAGGGDRGPRAPGSGSADLPLRPRLGESIFSGAPAGGPIAQGIPRAVHRQGQPGAFLLGSLRSGGHAVFGPPGAAASGRHSARRRSGDARGVFAGSEQRRFLGGRSRLPEAAFYAYAYPFTRRFRRGARAPRGRALSRRWASSCCRTRRCAARRIPRPRSWRSCRAATKPRPISRNGIAPGWNETKPTRHPPRTIGPTRRRAPLTRSRDARRILPPSGRSQTTRGRQAERARLSRVPEVGWGLGSPAALPRLRPCRLLRQLAQPPRHQTLPPDATIR